MTFIDGRIKCGTCGAGITTWNEVKLSDTKYELVCQCGKGKITFAGKPRIRVRGK